MGAPCEKIITTVGFKDIWELEREDVTLGEKIGDGNFGEVYKGILFGKRDPLTGDRRPYPAAIKTLKLGKKSRETSPAELEKIKADFLDELEIMKKIGHANLVKLWGVCTIEEPFLLVAEFMVNGSLLSYLRDGKGKNLTRREAVDIAAQIACGMRYLEQNGYVHRDLAARNILVGERNMVKIADFGLAKMLDSGEKPDKEQKTSTQLPIKWTAPETLNDPRQFSTKSDVWSYGILLYELFTKGGTPYPDMKPSEVMRELRLHRYRMPKPPGELCTDEIYMCMQRCWKEDPAERPTFNALFEYFENFDELKYSQYN